MDTVLDGIRMIGYWEMRWPCVLDYEAMGARLAHAMLAMLLRSGTLGL